MSSFGDYGIKNIDTKMVQTEVKAYIVTGEDEDGPWWFLVGSGKRYSDISSATRFSFSEKGRATAEAYAAKKGGRVEEVCELIARNFAA
jgi:hypothetical protein